MRKILLIFTLVVSTTMLVKAQGVTTATMSGTITDAKGESLPGATVVAVHQPSGSEYGTTTREDGRYNIRRQ